MPLRGLQGRFVSNKSAAASFEDNLGSESQARTEVITETEIRTEEAESIYESTTNYTSNTEPTETAIKMTEPTRQVEIPKPPVFDGQGNITAFASKYHAYVQIADLTEVQAIERLPFSLTGEAYDEYFRLWREQLPPTSGSPTFTSDDIQCWKAQCHRMGL